MNKIFTFFIVILICFSASPREKGHLVIIGGGERTDSIMKKIISLAGGEEARIVIIPNASEEPLETAIYQADEFKKLGAKEVKYILCNKQTADADSNLAKLTNATCVFFSGGDQSFLTRDFLGSKLLARVREIYAGGGIVSGTSAGAAVMSKVMLTGNELINKDSTASFHTIQKNNVEAIEGFGFVTKAIIDQHFIKRRRNNRLISVVLQNPTLPGVGIDESTCIIVNPDDTFEVLGENQVIIYDATGAKDITTDKNNNLSAHELKMHILMSGQKFDLNTRQVIK
jgi:cyanophycinase